MSIDSGPKADSAPRSSTSRPCEPRRGERAIARDAIDRIRTALPTADEGMPTLHGDEVSPASVDGRVAPGVRAGTRGCGGGGGAPARGACGRRARARGGAATAGAPPRTIRLKTAAAVALVAAAVAGGAFAAGALLHDDAKVQPLPAVSGKPIAPDKGQSRAGEIYAAGQPGRRLDPHRRRLGHRLPHRPQRHARHQRPRRRQRRPRRGQVRPDGRSIDGQVWAPTRRATSRSCTIDPAARRATPSRCSSPTRARSRWATPRSRSATRSASTAPRPRASSPASGARSRRPTASRSTRSSRPTRRSTPATPAARCSTTTGRVIGVNSQIATAGNSQGNVGIGFAVPSNTVREVVPRLEKGETIARPYLGVETADPTDRQRARRRRGRRRSRPAGPPRAPACSAGDVITELDGQAVERLRRRLARSSTPSSPATTSTSASTAPART